ncbi:unnamed protein product [Meloidogyne enterolobii]|uniref:Uncharacterized protein n=1 Tax=Meloidogyne enterolobii TaxID=390850 RepID=A0ACB0XTC1_MELEN
MSKKKRDRERKKILEFKKLEKESVDECLDDKMKDIEAEVRPKIIEENTSMGSGEITVTEAEKRELEGPKIGEQKTAEKFVLDKLNFKNIHKNFLRPIMKNAQVKISKFSKGKDKTNFNKNVKAKHGKMDKKEAIDNIVKSDVELKQTNELTLFEENNEVFLYPICPDPVQMATLNSH